jgi:hypothetical protein
MNGLTVKEYMFDPEESTLERTRLTNHPKEVRLEVDESCDLLSSQRIKFFCHD